MGESRGLSAVPVVTLLLLVTASAKALSAPLDVSLSAEGQSPEPSGPSRLEASGESDLSTSAQHLGKGVTSVALPGSPLASRDPQDDPQDDPQELQDPQDDPQDPQSDPQSDPRDPQGDAQGDPQGDSSWSPESSASAQRGWRGSAPLPDVPSQSSESSEGAEGDLNSEEAMAAQGI